MPLLISIDELKKLKEKKRGPKRFRQTRGSSNSERQLRKALEALWKEVLHPASEKLKRMAKQKVSPIIIADYLDEVLTRAEFEYGIKGSQFLTSWKISMEDLSRQALFAGLKESLGVDLKAFYDTPIIKEVLQGGSMDASLLIKSIPRDFLGQVAEAVRKNFTGEPLPDGRTLLAQIEYLGGVSRKRAKLIARDQSKKLNATLNQHRQESIGITMYIWRTVRDERVVGKPGGLYPKGNKAHGNHYMMEGVYCRWDDPTVYSIDKGKTWKMRTSEMPKTHPGVDIQCRCHAEPVIDIQQILQYAEAA